MPRGYRQNFLAAPETAASARDTIYRGRIDAYSSDFRVQEFRRNSLPVSVATISADPA
jgi:hypothetical protein